MAELFSEIYNCYFQVIQSLARQSRCIPERELGRYIQEHCFEESILYLLPKLTENGWGFYEKKNGMFCAKLSGDFYVPLTDLQKSYLKAILADDKIGLFLEEAEIAEMNQALAGVEPLFLPEDFYYYDRFSDRDDYADPAYKKRFRIILGAIKSREYLEIFYESGKNRRIHLTCLPCRMEYSVRNDCFRLLAACLCAGQKFEVKTLNVSRMVRVVQTHSTPKRMPDIDRYLKKSYSSEPVRVIIKDKRNALERAMLQFANYEKSTKRLADGTYECLIYYRKEMETELLIEVLSFGPMLKVVGHEAFLRLVRKRIKRQEVYFSRHCSLF